MHDLNQWWFTSRVSELSELQPQYLSVCSGLHGVSELRYRSNDSTALWMSSLAQHPAMVFLYELSLENGTTIQRSHVTDTELHLPGLEESKNYILDVWEQCDGKWESEHSRLCFEGANSSLGHLMRSAGHGLHQGWSV